MTGKTHNRGRDGTLEELDEEDGSGGRVNRLGVDAALQVTRCASVRLMNLRSILWQTGAPRAGTPPTPRSAR